MSSGHTQEPTAFSLTDIVVGNGESRDRQPLVSVFSGEALTRSSPELITGCEPRQPERLHEQTLDPRLTSATIPPEHAHRTLVLCFDGTGDQFDADNSNIVQLVSLLKKNDRSKQMVYYQSGIGTYTSPQVASPFTAKISKARLFWRLRIFDAKLYDLPSPSHEGNAHVSAVPDVEGDKICIFGFSRGAYTARSLAGMIHKVGLLPADNFQQVPFAYKMYTRADHVGWEQSNAFKEAFSIDTDIEFIGVWDTVDSVGLIPKRLPFTTSNTIVHTFRHAIALDEQRAKFKANLWNRPTAAEERLGLSPHQPNVVASPIPLLKEKIRLKRVSPLSFSNERESEEERVLSEFEKRYAEKEAHDTDFEEVWFSGCHCDVGGGSVHNKIRHSFARISLRWMVRQCFKTNTGIMFDSVALRNIGLDPSTLYPFVTPRPPPLPVGSEAYHKFRKPPMLERILAYIKKNAMSDFGAPILTNVTEKVEVISEEHEDLKDALSPVYDQLKLKRFWWIIEILPLNFRYQRDDNEWVSYVGSKFARPRFIPKQHSNGVKVHRTVKHRMEAYPPPYSKKKKRYPPGPLLAVEPIWID